MPIQIRLCGMKAPISKAYTGRRADQVNSGAIMMVTMRSRWLAMVRVAIVTAFLPVAFWLRTTKFYQVGVFKWGSVLIALMALYWFVQRAFDL